MPIGGVIHEDTHRCSEGTIELGFELDFADNLGSLGVLCLRLGHDFIGDQIVLIAEEGDFVFDGFGRFRKHNELVGFCQYAYNISVFFYFENGSGQDFSLRTFVYFIKHIYCVLVIHPEVGVVHEYCRQFV